MADDLVKRLDSLHKQATVERSHFYVGSCAEDAIRRIEELELAVRYEADLAQMALDARKELEVKLAKAENALFTLSYIHDGNPSDARADILPLDYARHMLWEARSIARTTLAELSKERSDEKGQDAVVDDLVKRLRDRDHVGTPTEERNLVNSAADRIEELEAKLAKAVELANLVSFFLDPTLRKVVKQAVLELKGQDDE